MVERLEKARLESIHQGNMIYESETGSGDIDIFVAVVKSVNVDENYVTALDMSLGGKERKYFVLNNYPPRKSALMMSQSRSRTKTAPPISAMVFLIAPIFERKFIFLYLES